MNTHSFNTITAQKIGINAAIILNHIGFWVEKMTREKHRDEHFRGGRYWVYLSYTDFEHRFEYLGRKQIRNALAKLIAKGYIEAVTGKVRNQVNSRWYTLTERGKIEMGIEYSDSFDHFPGYENMAQDEQGYAQKAQTDTQACAQKTQRYAQKAQDVCQKDTRVCQNGTRIYTDTNTYTNCSHTQTDTAKVSDASLSKEFERLWCMYPSRKRFGKTRAKTSYITARKRGISYEAFKETLDNYNSYITKCHVPLRYIKNADNWFTQDPWEAAYNKEEYNPTVNYSDRWTYSGQRKYTIDALRQMGVNFGDDEYGS